MVTRGHPFWLKGMEKESSWNLGRPRTSGSSIPSPNWTHPQGGSVGFPSSAEMNTWSLHDPILVERNGESTERKLQGRGDAFVAADGLRCLCAMLLEEEAAGRTGRRPKANSPELAFWLYPMVPHLVKVTKDLKKLDLCYSPLSRSIVVSTLLFPFSLAVSPFSLSVSLALSRSLPLSLPLSIFLAALRSENSMAEREADSTRPLCKIPPHFLVSPTGSILSQRSHKS